MSSDHVGVETESLAKGLDRVPGRRQRRPDPAQGIHYDISNTPRPDPLGVAFRLTTC